MSGKLSGRGLEAVMPSHASKIVLWKLLDACEPDGTRIYPGITSIARVAQVSERQAQRIMRLFVKAKLLLLVSQGGRGPGDTTEYRLDMPLFDRLVEEGWAAVFGATDAILGGPKKGDTVQSPLDDEQSAEKGDATSPLPKGDISAPKGDISRSKGDTQMSPDPSVDPPTDPEREKRAQNIEDAFQRIVVAYPGVATDDIAKGRFHFDALSGEDRKVAEAALPKWRKFLEGQRRRPPLAEYLRDRRWTLIPDQKPVGDVAAGEPMLPLVQAFDRAWWWLFFDCLNRNQISEARRRANMAKARIGWKIEPSKRAAIEESAKHFVQIEVDGPAFKAWQRIVDDLPRPDLAKYIFVPSEFPPKPQGITAKEIAEAWGDT